MVDDCVAENAGQESFVQLGLRGEVLKGHGAVQRDGAGDTVAHDRV